jgi:hypothetical protein
MPKESSKMNIDLFIAGMILKTEPSSINLTGLELCAVESQYLRSA